MKKKEIIVVTIFSVLIIASFLIPYWIKFGLALSGEHQVWSEFGNVLGAIVSILAFGGALWAIYKTSKIAEKANEISKQIASDTGQLQSKLNQESDNLRKEISEKYIKHDKELAQAAYELEREIQNRYEFIEERNLFFINLESFADTVEKIQYEENNKVKGRGLTAIKKMATKQKQISIAYLLAEMEFNDDFKQTIFDSFDNPLELSNIQRQYDDFQMQLGLILEAKHEKNCWQSYFQHNYKEHKKYADFIATSPKPELKQGALKCMQQHKIACHFALSDYVHENYVRWELFTGLTMLSLYQRERFDVIYQILKCGAEGVYERQESNLGVYFRNVYYNLDLINSFHKTPKKNKVDYFKRFSSQLSRYEIALLSFNALSDLSSIKTLNLYSKAEIYNNVNLHDLFLSFDDVVNREKVYRGLLNYRIKILRMQ